MLWVRIRIAKGDSNAYPQHMILYKKTYVVDTH